MAKKSDCKKYFAIDILYHWKSNEINMVKFERRTIACLADDCGAAKNTLLSAAKEYEDETIEMIGLMDLREFEIPEDGEAVEVYSELNIGWSYAEKREVSAEEYYETRWFFGKIESCEDIGSAHSWYKKDDRTKGCYSCLVVKNTETGSEGSK